MANIMRLIATVSAQFNDLVDQVENHEAVAASALKRFRIQAQEAKVQVKLLEKELEQATKNRERAVAEGARWKERAKASAAADKARALECVQRLKGWQTEETFWSQKASELAQTVQQLQSELSTIDQRQNELRLELQKYVARDRTCAIKELAQPDSVNDTALEDIFRRWDKKLIRQEVVSDLNRCNVDQFATEMKREEEAAELESALLAILQDE